jgi:hypothetical protein
MKNIKRPHRRTLPDLPFARLRKCAALDRKLANMKAKYLRWLNSTLPPAEQSDFVTFARPLPPDWSRLALATREIDREPKYDRPRTMADPAIQHLLAKCGPNEKTSVRKLLKRVVGGFPLSDSQAEALLNLRDRS